MWLAEQIVADSQVQREIRSNLPVILEVGCPPPLPHFRYGNSLRSEGCARIAQQVSGGAVPRNVARERHISKRPVVGGCVIPQPPEVSAHLYRMGPANDTKIVDDLVSTAVIQVRRRRAVAHSEKALDANYRKALLILAQRPTVGTADLQPTDAQRFDREIGVRTRAQPLDMTLNPTKSNFVQHGR